MTQTDATGTEFDPIIHAVKKDGTPKKTPRGTWALLVDAPQQSGVGETSAQTRTPATPKLSRNEIICDWLRSKGATVKLTGSNLSVTGFSVFDLNLDASTEFVVLALSSLGYNQVGELEELLQK